MIWVTTLMLWLYTDAITRASTSILRLAFQHDSVIRFSLLTLWLGPLFCKLFLTPLHSINLLRRERKNEKEEGQTETETDKKTKIYKYIYIYIYRERERGGGGLGGSSPNKPKRVKDHIHWRRLTGRTLLRRETGLGGSSSSEPRRVKDHIHWRRLTEQ